MHYSIYIKKVADLLVAAKVSICKKTSLERKIFKCKTICK